MFNGDRMLAGSLLVFVGLLLLLILLASGLTGTDPITVRQWIFGSLLALFALILIGVGTELVKDK